MLPTLFGGFGLYGLECKTRKCTVINMDPEGNPTSVNPKVSLGSNTALMTFALLATFNGAIYYRLWVTYFLLISFKKVEIEFLMFSYETSINLPKCYRGIQRKWKRCNHFVKTQRPSQRKKTLAD